MGYRINRYPGPEVGERAGGETKEKSLKTKTWSDVEEEDEEDKEGEEEEEEEEELELVS